MPHVCMCIKGFLNSHPPSAKLIPTVTTKIEIKMY